MNWTEIPTPFGLAHSEQVTTLSGSRYTVKLDWVQRWQVWTITVLADDDTAIVEGAPLLNGVDVFARLRHDERVPPGALLVWSNQGKETEPGLRTLGRGQAFTLMYVTQ